MCYPVNCRQCGKTTWSGCGMHVDQVMRGVPKNERCEGHEPAPGVQGGSFLTRMFGR
ncbi:hypothetical protein HT102_11345 [Hoyosella sp. G463]|uniref:Uncharacterized protein n=1 Tax=Lolliginicoccus lacisalsi TaxID=2742202 RepID=A0A927JD13_9ACTN|nr:hypothetical protein [Lolliginicoccus lacisalsi]MBD8507083.1 hypothetical protein [Lolliginicoccus lacisalsi]